LLVEYLGEENNFSLNSQEIKACEWVKLDDIWHKIDHNNENFCNYKKTIKDVLKEFNFY
jgi:isopentenyldiphosphate isomerase